MGDGFRGHQAHLCRENDFSSYTTKGDGEEIPEMEDTITAQVLEEEKFFSKLTLRKFGLE